MLPSQMTSQADFKNKILNTIGIIIKDQAIHNCPVDMGSLRASIKYRIEGNSVIIYSDSEHAHDMEYGSPPGLLSPEEKEQIGQWAERHGLPKYAIIKSIQKKGVKAGTIDSPHKNPDGVTMRPFLRPALYQSIPKIRSTLG